MAWQVPMLVALLVLPFSGCFGSDEADAAGLGEVPSPEATGGTGSPGPGEGEPTGGVDPADPDLKFHTHDAWGDRDRYVLFDGDLDIGMTPQEEFRLGPNGLVVGFREFTTEDDGDDDGSADKKDIVPQGTRQIDLTLTWTDTTIPGLRFFFKTANGPEFLELGPVTSGATYTIAMQPKWADMPHRDSVSRWRFRVEAHDPTQGAIGVHVARGAFDVRMEVLRGDETYIDPPHPFFYTQSDVRPGGEIQGTVSSSVTVTAAGTSLATNPARSGLRPPPPNIVAWETTVLRAWLTYNYSGPLSAADHRLGLRYHGAESLAYLSPEPEDEDVGMAYYEIPVDETMTDSPYAFETDWEYAVYPITAGQSDQGDFQGDFQIRLETVKQ